jgi:predicted hydrolase (HD superfamily)
MERHGLRDFLIADRLATARELEVDREILLITGLLHDIGLYDEASHGGVYVHEGAEFTAELLRAQGWDGARIRLCSDAIERHHETRSQWERGAEVEVIRRADLVDLTSGLVTFGLPREWLRDLFRSVSRDGTYATVGRQVANQLIHRPLQFAQIFRR